MEGKPSKSARKREQLALQALGERLIGLREDQLRQVPLEPDLYDAVVAATSMKAHGALRRQRQLIGKIMRRVDPQPIRAALDALAGTDQRDKAVFHQAEAWRDRIVAERGAAARQFSLHIGQSCEALDRLVDDLDRCRTDEECRSIGRRIFRAVHDALRAKVQNGAS